MECVNSSQSPTTLARASREKSVNGWAIAFWILFVIVVVVIVIGVIMYIRQKKKTGYTMVPAKENEPMLAPLISPLA
jgi:heme/copper-type cytochrome/quinol oxidase subunit 2